MVKVGVQSGGWYNDSDPLGSFEYIKECGFEAVDFNIDMYFSTRELAASGKKNELFEKPVEEVLDFFTPLKKASEETGVIVSQMHAPFPVFYPGMPEVNEYILTVLDKCFAVCEYVGCPAIVVHPTEFDFSVEYERNLEIYRGLIPVIKKYNGVKICLENLFNTRANGVNGEGRLSNADDCVKMLDTLNAEAGGDYFGFCFDIGHANLSRRNVKSFVTTLGKRLTVMHVHDNDGIMDLHMIPYSYLTPAKVPYCDWTGFVEGLKDIGYDGTIAFETFRIFRAYPKGAHTAALQLISAIGRCWVEELSK
ncbi:MAG: sugar phosphate isomerase/epimerase [Oscillospiraceae bacterium]|nr:sugar phosphate isomerase/epimerase [Oscillospiraceae bacterium]MBQ4136902.1 sugar phosphate isomerase/epimerase [Clostridia bacterium]